MLKKITYFSAAYLLALTLSSAVHARTSAKDFISFQNEIQVHCQNKKNALEYYNIKISPKDQSWKVQGPAELQEFEGSFKWERKVRFRKSGRIHYDFRGKLGKHWREGKLRLSFTNKRIQGEGEGHIEFDKERANLFCFIKKGLIKKEASPKNFLKKGVDATIESVGTWLGDTRIHRKSSLTKQEQIEEMNALLLPGDILVERRDWFLSNFFINEFWTHSLLYLGSPEKAGEYFDNDEETYNYFAARGYHGFLNYVQIHFPEVYEKWTSGNNGRLLESTSDGVVLNNFGDSDGYLPDHIGAVRPRLRPLEKALALTKALSYYGTPYDFDFDFTDDSRIVCSELVERAYAPQEGASGVNFKLGNMPFGKKGLSPNSIIKQYYQKYRSPRQQLDFVYYIKGDEEKGTSTSASEKELRFSWRKKGGIIGEE